MYSSFLYSIYIFTEIIYTSPIYPPARIVIFPHFFLCPFRAFFIFRAVYILPTRKNFSEKKLVRKKIFLFLRKKFLLFWKSPQKKNYFFIYKIFFPPNILLRSVLTITVGISESRQNKLVRREYIYSAWGTRGQEVWNVQRVWGVPRI